MQEITVEELIKRLQQVLNQQKPVRIWNPEYSIADPIDDIDETPDEVVLY